MTFRFIDRGFFASILWKNGVVNSKKKMHFCSSCGGQLRYQTPDNLIGLLLPVIWQKSAILVLATCQCQCVWGFQFWINSAEEVTPNKWLTSDTPCNDNWLPCTPRALATFSSKKSHSGLFCLFPAHKKYFWWAAGLSPHFVVARNTRGTFFPPP